MFFFCSNPFKYVESIDRAGCQLGSGATISAFAQRHDACDCAEPANRQA